MRVQTIVVLPPGPNAPFPVVPCTTPRCRYVQPAPGGVSDKDVVAGLVHHLHADDGVTVSELVHTQFRLVRERQVVASAAARRGGPPWT